VQGSPARSSLFCCVLPCCFFSIRREKKNEQGKTKSKAASNEKIFPSKAAVDLPDDTGKLKNKTEDIDHANDYPRREGF